MSGNKVLYLTDIDVDKGFWRNDFYEKYCNLMYFDVYFDGLSFQNSPKVTIFDVANDDIVAE